MHTHAETQRFALEAARVGAWEWDVTSGAVSWSPNLEALHGLPPGTFGGTFESFLEGVHPEDRPAVQAAIRAALQGGGDYECEYRLNRGDGPTRWVQGRGRAFRNGAGRPLRMVGVCMDVTERRRAEEELLQVNEGLEQRVQQRTHELEQANAALRASEARFRALAENGTDGLLLAGADGIIVFDGLTTGRILGYAGEDFAGRDLFELVHPDDQEQVRGRFAGVLRQPGRRASVRFRARCEDGSWRWLEAVGSNRLEDPALQAVVVTYRDVTDSLRAEEALRQAQKMEAVGLLAGGVAHEFNNLLTVITGYSELLLAQLGPAETGGPLAHQVEQIKGAAARAATLTAQLLAFGGRALVSPVTLDLNALLRELEPVLRQLLGGGIELSLEVDAGLGWVRADPVQLRQAVLAVCVRARDSMPQGGRLTLRTADVVLSRTRGGPGPSVLLEVSDTGTGMTEEERARVFEPSFAPEGPGLGLAAAYGIVKQAGGRVEVESAPGRGSTFRVYLPRVEPGMQAGAPAGPRDWPRGTETVLLAEDEPALRGLTEIILRQCGYTVLAATDGAEALRVFERHAGPVQLLVTDVEMPRVNGVELAAQLSSLVPGLRVLYLSGYTEDVFLRHGVSGAGLNFLAKPFRPKDLACKVREVLDLPGEPGA